MNKVLSVVLILLSTVSAFAQSDIAKIKERGSNREIVYSRTSTEMIFTLKQGDFKSILKTLKVESDSNSLTITGSRDNYEFEILSASKDLSARSYQWCWSPADKNENFPRVVHSFVFIPVAATLCAIVPGVPFLVGILLTPADGLITLADANLSKEALASRKFAKLFKGKDGTASSQVFDELLAEISEL